MIGLAQFVVGVVLSDFPVRLPHFCCFARWQGQHNILLCSRGHRNLFVQCLACAFFVEVVLPEAPVGLSQFFFCLSGGGGNFLLSSRG